MLKNDIFFRLKNSGNINFIKEIDGGEFSLPAGGIEILLKSVKDLQIQYILV